MAGACMLRVYALSGGHLKGIETSRQAESPVQNINNPPLLSWAIVHRQILSSGLPRGPEDKVSGFRFKPAVQAARCVAQFEYSSGSNIEQLCRLPASKPHSRPIR